MARITVLSIPAYGHLIPMLGVFAELVRRGHEVTVVNRPEQRELIEGTGARFAEYPPALTTADFTRVLKNGNLIAAFELLLEATPPLTDWSLDFLARERPDVVVYDCVSIWGYIARKKLGLRSVSDSPIFVYEFLRHLPGMGEFFGHARNFIPAFPKLAWLWMRMLRFGLTNLPLAQPMLPMRGDKDVMLTSREVHPKSPIFDKGNWIFAGASIDPNTRHDPFDFSRLDGRPLVLVSLGTVQFTNDAFFKTVMDTFADYPAQFVLAAGPGSDPARLGTPPDNFIVQQTYPQLPLLERAAAFISHGGLGSVHEGLWHGVPMVGVPQHWEQLRNLLAASSRGAAIVLDARCYGREVPGADIRVALEQVMSDPSYRENARRLGQSLRQGGGYVTVANVIEDVAGKSSREFTQRSSVAGT